MTDPVMSDTASYADDEKWRVDTACMRFEQAWRTGTPLRIEEFLADSRKTPIGDALLKGLLACEVQLRRESGEAPSLGDYRDRFPDKVRLIEEVLQADPTAQVGRQNAPLPNFGQYEIVKSLGRGGQATTYLARDKKLGNHVVLKVYQSQGVTFREKAVEEGRALVRVDSPYVAHCLGVQEDHGQLALVMEYVPGRDLSKTPSSELGNERNVALLVERLAEGLAEVHASGQLHRDIKPHNVILGHDGVPKLVDFGLAAPFASEVLNHRSGSPPYMAPEQADGQTERIGPRTDIFGLGALLYFLLTGRPPFQGATQQETVELARQGKFDAPHVHNPSISKGLEAICLKAMASDPRGRYGSATEMAADLGRFRTRRVLLPRVLGGSAAIMSLVVLVWIFLPREVTPPSPPPPPIPLSGRLEIFVETPLKLREQLSLMAGKNLEPIQSEGMLPVLKGEGVRLKVSLNQPAYVYLIWVGNRGTIDPLYPWSRSFDKEPIAMGPVQELVSPPFDEDEKKWANYEMQGPSGMETAILLARRTPLPQNVDLASLLESLPPAPLRNPTELVSRYIDETDRKRVMASEGSDPIATAEREIPLAFRVSPDTRDLAAEVQESDQPLDDLLNRLRPHFDLIHAIRFGYQEKLP